VQHEPPITELSRLGAESLGVFHRIDAARRGVSRKQLARLRTKGVIERVLPGTYRIVAVAPSNEQALRAALLWAGEHAAAAGASAGELYHLEGVRAERPEIVVPRSVRAQDPGVLVQHSDDRKALMVRRVRTLPATGIECTLVRLAAALDGEAFEIACEDARRRRLTSVPALRAYLERFGQRGRPGVAPMRHLLDQLDPIRAARSTLEVKTRRLLIAHGMADFVREFPLTWNGCTYRYDFVFAEHRLILETNGRRWHDDSSDYERDNEKWSVPGRHGYRIVFATWEKVVRDPNALVRELAAAMLVSS
jgi:very-short-patch-repair endonuclease